MDIKSIECSKTYSSVKENFSFLGERPYFIKSLNNLPHEMNSILAIQDRYCFLWSRSDTSLYVFEYADMVEWVTGRSEAQVPPEPKKYGLHEVIDFEVTDILMCELEWDKILLWGPKGAATLKLPTADVASSISLKTNVTKLSLPLLDEDGSFYIIKARWMRNFFVIILYSDGFLRLFNVDGDLITSINGGNKDFLPGFSNMDYDESVVDFDVSMKFPKSGYTVVFILAMDCTLSYVLIRPHVANTCLVESVVPVLTSNSESESYRAKQILVTDSYPIVVVVALENGNIFHYIVTPNQFDEYGAGVLDVNIEQKFLNGDINLIKKEALEFERWEIEYIEAPLMLLPDPFHRSRYAFVGANAVYVVEIRCLEILNRILKGLPRISETEKIFSVAAVREIVRWQNHDSEGRKNLVGINFSSAYPQRLVCILRNLNTVLYTLPDCFKIGDVDFLTPDEATNDLKTEISQVCNEVISQAITERTWRFGGPSDLALSMCCYVHQKQYYLIKLMKGLSAVEKFMDRVIDRCQKLSSKLYSSSQNETQLRKLTEVHAVKCKELADFDEKFEERINGIIYKLSCCSTSLSTSEKRWLEELTATSQLIHILKAEINERKAKIKREKKMDRLKSASSFSQVQLQGIHEELKSQNKTLLEIVNELLDYFQCLSMNPLNSGNAQSLKK